MGCSSQVAEWPIFGHEPRHLVFEPESIPSLLSSMLGLFVLLLRCLNVGVCRIHFLDDSVRAVLAQFPPAEASDVICLCKIVVEAHYPPG